MTTKIVWQPQSFLRELKVTLGNKLEESAEIVRENAKENCPVISGALKADIQQITDKPNLVAHIGNNLEYSIFVELGTRKFSPRRYLTKGLIASISRIQQIFSSR